MPISFLNLLSILSSLSLISALPDAFAIAHAAAGAGVVQGPALLKEHPPSLSHRHLPPRSTGKFSGAIYCCNSDL